MAHYILSLFLFFFLLEANAQTGKLVVVVKGIAIEKGGELSTGIFVKENFPEVGKQLLGNETVVSAKEMQIVFEKVPPGTYGVVSFQDIDRDKKLKTNFIGFPTEPIGFSRGAKIKMGPPDFEDAKISIGQNEVATITIVLK